MAEPAAAKVGPDRPAVPVLYVTDVFQPKVDADDHYDLATLYALPGIAVQSVILDQAGNVFGAPKRGIPVDQLNFLTSRRVPWVMGADTALATVDDTLIGSGEQAGIVEILRVLQQSATPVTVVSVGSARDLGAAFNRDPALFRAKVDRLFLFAGDGKAGAPQEWNVALDPNGYVALLRSGLGIHWVPSWDGGVPNVAAPYRASHWRASVGDVLVNTSPALQQFFLYMDRNADPNLEPKFDTLLTSVDGPARDRFFAGAKDLYAAAILMEVAGRRTIVEGSTGRRSSVGRDDAAPEGWWIEPVWSFDTVDLDPTYVAGHPEQSGITRYGHSATSRPVKRFRQIEASTYPTAMTQLTGELLGRSKAWIARPLTPGLLARWSFDERDTRVAYDASGAGYAGTLSGRVRRVPDGRVGSAIHFDGSAAAFVDVTWGLLTGNTSRSIALWFRTSSAVDSNWLGWGDQAVNAMTSVGILGGRVGYLGFLDDLTTDAAPFLDGAWHHLAVTFDGSTLALYLDGAKRASKTTTLATGRSPLQLGRSPAGIFGYEGDLDGVSVYDTALAAPDVSKLATGE